MGEAIRQRTIIGNRHTNIQKLFYNYKKKVIILQLFSIALLRARVRHARTHSISETLRISLRRNTTLVVEIAKEVARRANVSSSVGGLKTKAAGPSVSTHALKIDYRYFTYVNYGCKILMAIKPANNRTD